MDLLIKFGVGALTTGAIAFIIYILVKTNILFKQKNKRLYSVKGRQTTIHELIQGFLPTNEDFIRVLIAKKRGMHPSQNQSRQRYNPDKIKVVVVGDRAYWVQDHVFYQTVVTEDGEIDQSLAIPVDTTNMNQEDIDRLLHIVDDLRSTEEDDGNSPRD
jgi:hypothetical protein